MIREHCGDHLSSVTGLPSGLPVASLSLSMPDISLQRTFKVGPFMFTVLRHHLSTSDLNCL